MASVNKFLGIGNLTRDPEVRVMTNGESVANCSIACNETWKAKDGSKQEKVEYINLVFYRSLAKIVGEYLKKGASIYVEGKLQTRKYQDKEGKDRYISEIIVNEMKMLGSKGSKEEAEQPTTLADRPNVPAQTGDFDGFDEVDF